MPTTLKAQLPAVFPWMIGASIAFIIRLSASLGGMNGYNADALSMYLFLSVSIMIVAWRSCVPMLLRGCEGSTAVTARVLPLATLCMASAMTGVFVSLLVRDF